MDLQLNNNYVAIIDDEDFERVSQHTWSGGAHSSGVVYVTTKIKQKTTYLHSFILNTKNQIDHKNHNGLDCQKSNLRFCTQQQNLFNTRKRKNCSSVYKGVSWYKANKKWSAYIQIDYVKEHLGYFETELAAALEYDKFAKRYFGEFASTNFNSLEAA